MITEKINHYFDWFFLYISTLIGNFLANFTVSSWNNNSGFILNDFAIKSIFLQVRFADNTTVITPSTIVKTDFQVEEGSIATPYEPYHYNLIPIDLAGNSIAKVVEIADLLNIGVDGSVSIEKKNIEVILDGVNKKFIAKSSSVSNKLFFTNILNTNVLTPSDNSDVLEHYSNYFKGNYSINSLSASDLKGSAIRNDKIFGFGFGLDSNLDTLELANAWLQEKNNEGNPVYVITPLEEQYYETIPLPSIEPIKLIEGITNVFELVTNLGTTMAVIYKVSNKKKILNLEERISALESAVIGG